MSITLGVDFPTQRQPEPEPAPDPTDLRLSLVLAALEDLRSSLNALPAPQVTIDAPDLSAIVNAVNGLRPGVVDPREIGEAVANALIPMRPAAADPEWQDRLVKALDKLDFRMQGIGSGSGGPASLPPSLSSAPASDTGQTAMPVRVISQLGAGTGGGGATTLADGADAAQGTTTDAEAAAGNGTVIALLKRIRTLLSGTLATSRTWTLASGTDTVTVIQSGTVTTDVSDRTARLLGHVTVDSAPTTPVTGTFWQTTQPVSGTVAVSNLPGATTLTYNGRAGTFRTLGRAGTTGQKLLSIMNAVGSGKTVTVNSLSVDLVATVVKAVTVLPPVIRVYRITAVPTGGSAVTKASRNTALTSAAGVTLLQDASADGTNAAVALNAVTTAGAVLAQEFAHRLITAVGYEMFDRTVFFADGDTTVTLQAGEGLVLALDYTLATQNPTTDNWIVGVEWDES